MRFTLERGFEPKSSRARPKNSAQTQQFNRCRESRAAAAHKELSWPAQISLRAARLSPSLFCLARPASRLKAARRPRMSGQSTLAAPKWRRPSWLAANSKLEKENSFSLALEREWRNFSCLDSPSGRPGVSSQRGALEWPVWPNCAELKRTSRSGANKGARSKRGPLVRGLARACRKLALNRKPQLRNNDG